MPYSDSSSDDEYYGLNSARPGASQQPRGVVRGTDRAAERREQQQARRSEWMRNAKKVQRYVDLTHNAGERAPWEGQESDSEISRNTYADRVAGDDTSWGSGRNSFRPAESDYPQPRTERTARFDRHDDEVHYSRVSNDIGRMRIRDDSHHHDHQDHHIMIALHLLQRVQHALCAHQEIIHQYLDEVAALQGAQNHDILQVAIGLFIIHIEGI